SAAPTAAPPSPSPSLIHHRGEVEAGRAGHVGSSRSAGKLDPPSRGGARGRGADGGGEEARGGGGGFELRPARLLLFL
ncbi:unnamed protein product, partial [Urochloa humidicola]